MKKLLITFSIITIFSVTQAFAQFEGTKGMGANAGYGAQINSLGVGAHVHYYHSNNLRFAPSFTYYLPRKGNSMWIIDADAHYVIPVSVSASLYPIAGLTYSNWRYDASAANNAFGDDWRKHRVGANLGLGIQHDISYRLRANFELKYQFIKDFSQVSFMAGIGFWI